MLRYFLLSSFFLVVNGYDRYTATPYGQLPNMALEWDKPELFYDGDIWIYVLGMHKVGNGRQILRFNVTGDVDDSHYAKYEVVGEFPAMVRRGAAAADSAGNIYHFGGYTDDYVLSKSIYRVTMNTTVEPILLGTEILKNRTGHRAVTFGDNIYLIGGDYDCGIYRPCAASTIEEFSLTTLTSRIVATLPEPITHLTFPAVVTDGKLIYMFGGFKEIDYSEIKYDTILTFDPATYEVVVLDERLPELVSQSTAVWVDGLAYIFPGAYESTQDDDMFVFDPETNQVSLADIGIYVWFAHNAVYVTKQRRIFIFGVCPTPSEWYTAYAYIYHMDIPVFNKTSTKLQ